MMLTASRLLDLTAEVLMSRAVVAIPEDMSLRAAAHLLAQVGVSGAPVVDPLGRCVGVLSKTDLVRFFDQDPERPHAPEAESMAYCNDWQVFDLDALPIDNVSRYMTTHLITASPNSRVAELARIMHRGHIHRVLITDPVGRVIGIVSSMDILSAVAAEDPDSHE